MEMIVYQQIARSLDAYRNCLNHHTQPGMGHLTEWIDKHANRAYDLCKEYMPSGSGFNSGTTLEIDRCADDKLVFFTQFHHMNENGYYDGWTMHTVTVRPSLVNNIEIKVGGRDRNQIKDYIYQVFEMALNTEVNDDTR